MLRIAKYLENADSGEEEREVLVSGEALRLRIMRTLRVDILVSSEEKNLLHSGYFSLLNGNSVVEDENEKTFEVSLINATMAPIKVFDNVKSLYLIGDTLRIECDDTIGAFEVNIVKILEKTVHNSKPFEISIQYAKDRVATQNDKIVKKSYVLGYSIIDEMKRISQIFDDLSNMPKFVPLETIITDSAIDIWAGQQNTLSISLVDAMELHETIDKFESLIKHFEIDRQKLEEAMKNENTKA